MSPAAAVAGKLRRGNPVIVCPRECIHVHMSVYCIYRWMNCDPCSHTAVAVCKMSWSQHLKPEKKITDWNVRKMKVITHESQGSIPKPPMVFPRLTQQHLLPVVPARLNFPTALQYNMSSSY